MNRSALLAALLLAAFVAAATADMGGMPFGRNVVLFEPNQRAMIAWSGREEILLLTTDLHLSEPGKVLEVTALPSRPEVKAGDLETFRKATELINAKIPRPRTGGFGGGLGGMQEEGAPAGVVVFHQQIGAHEISVTRSLNAAGFIDWAEKLLRQGGAEAPSIPPAIQAAITQYIRDGYGWFVFDVVSLDKEPKTKQPIQFRFESRSLYYPLKISSANQGDTQIDLLILTPRLLTLFRGYPERGIELRHKPVSLTAAEVRSISPEMDDLLGHREDVKLRIWRIRGKLSGFTNDLIVE